MKFSSSKNKCLVGLFLLIFASACDNDESTIPECEVYLKTTYSEYQTLLMPNSCIVYSATSGVYPTNYKLGFGGVAIYRDLEGTLRCCDISCPYERLKNVVVSIDMPIATCPECGSQFDLSYGIGNVCKGPATSPLRSYTKIIDKGTYIQVTY